MRTWSSRGLRSLFVAVLLCSALAQPALAFGGFLVTKSDAAISSSASVVVLMRDGTRTVVSLQANYRGPVEDFALVIPLPGVVRKEDLHTLRSDVFQHLDTVAAPQLLEWREVDACTPGPRYGPSSEAGFGGPLESEQPQRAVKVQPHFGLNSYEFVLLGPEDSSRIEAWLGAEGYRVPKAASALLAPYLAANTRFLVAKAYPEYLAFEDGQALLPPIRFEYEANQLSLPIRLDVLNSTGPRDLVLNVLAIDRYEAANRPNVIIPTNVGVHEGVGADFAGFYEALLAAIGARSPGAVVTEYAWDPWWRCEKCTPYVTDTDFASLGGDSMPQADSQRLGRYTLTRLHYRYTPDKVGADLVFKPARPIAGGTGVFDRKGRIESDLRHNAKHNEFQAVYALERRKPQGYTCELTRPGMLHADVRRDLAATKILPNVALSGVADPLVLDAVLTKPIPGLGVKPAPARGARVGPR